MFRQTAAQMAEQTGQQQSETSAWHEGNGLVDCDVGGVHDFGYGDFGISTGNGRVFFGVRDAGNADVSIGSDAGYDDGKWHTVIATRSRVDGRFELFIDDNSVGSKTGNTDALNSGTKMTIGRLQPVLMRSVGRSRAWPSMTAC